MEGFVYGIRAMFIGIGCAGFIAGAVAFVVCRLAGLL